MKLLRLFIIVSMTLQILEAYHCLVPILKTRIRRFSHGRLNVELSDVATTDDTTEVGERPSPSLSSIERRQRKDEIKKSMPLSQAWYKAKQINLSKAQKRAINDWFPLYGIKLEYGTVLDPQTLFPRQEQQQTTPLKVILDIGFGLGDSITGMANARRDCDCVFMGCEIHKAGVASALAKIHQLNLTNVKLIRADVSMLLDGYLIDHCLDEVCVFFPDPWPNTERDGERRVIRKQTVDRLMRKLKPKGLLRIATDVSDYAQHVRDVMAGFSSEFQLVVDNEHPPCVNGPSTRPVTKYEKRAAELGNMVWDFEYRYEPST